MPSPSRLILALGTALALLPALRADVSVSALPQAALRAPLTAPAVAPGRPTATSVATTAASSAPTASPAATSATLAAAAVSADEKAAFEEARKLLKAGELDEARAAGMEALTLYPFSRDGYRLMMEIAEAADDRVDRLRWAKWLVWSTQYAGDPDKVEELAPLFEGEWEGWNRDAAILDAWEESLAEAADKAAGDKQYRLAGHLMDRLLELNPNDERLQRDYEKLADRAGQQLSGGAFVAASIRRKSPEWLARENKKHEHWENPFERETDNYEIYTNVSWEFAETLAAAMEEVNAFYREIYDYRKRASAQVYVMRRRSDFDKMSLKVLNRPMPSRGVGGYWVPAQRTVVAYDRAYDEEGFTQDALWNTLFHEASHQFMTLLAGRNRVPVWLNEGTASYFEGCEIKSDGTIVKNAPAVQRLVSWYNLDNSAERRSLEDLIAHERNVTDKDGSRSYEAEYYPYGWAFTYFLLNYEENDRRVYGALTGGGDIPESYKAVKKAGRLVYRDAYAKYLEYFTEEGVGGDRYYPLEVAKEMFVEEIDDPDCPTWEHFEDRWRTFCTSLYYEEQAGPEFADVLQARCRGYILAEDWERARVTAEQADAKRRYDPETYRLLAEANLGEGREEEAVYWMVRHWEMIFPEGNEEEIAAAEEWLDDHDGDDVLEHYIRPTEQAIAALEKACQDALDAGEPMHAVLFAVHGCEVLGMDVPRLTQHFRSGSAEGEISALELTGKDLRMWQRAFEGSAENNQQYEAPGLTVDVVRYDPDGLFLNNPEGPARPGRVRTSRRSLAELRAPYDVRGTVQVEGRGEMALGLDRNGRPSAALLFEMDGATPVCRLCTVGLTLDVNSGRAIPTLTQVLGYGFADGKKLDFALSFDAEGGGTIAGNGGPPQPMPEEFTLDRINGALALSAAESSLALFSDVEIRPARPFWPVP